jgi:hypothetical protein
VILRTARGSARRPAGVFPEILQNMRINPYFLPAVFVLLSTVPVQAQPGDPCDSLGIVAQATATPLTCTDPVSTLTGALVPNAIAYSWTGPGGFSSNQRVDQYFATGVYTFTVTGPLGCTAQTSVTVVDSCTSYPLMPPACDSLGPVPADEMLDACISICFTPVAGSTAGYSPSNLFSFCGTVENDQYFGFVAWTTEVAFNIWYGNCTEGNGIQAAIYTSPNDQYEYCDGGFVGNFEGMYYVAAQNLLPGETYYLMIDGYAGDQCDFTIEQVIPDSCLPKPPTILPDTSSIDCDTLCPGTFVFYQGPPTLYANAYLWTAPSGSFINGQQSPVVLYPPDGQIVELQVGQQDGFVCRRALSYAFPPSPPSCCRLVTLTIPPTVLPDTVICWDDAPYTLPWGQQAIISGLYSTTLESFHGCDSVVRQQVIVRPPLITNLGFKVICAGDCFSLGGTDYCTAGAYSAVLTSILGCDSIVNFSLAVLQPVAEISGGGELTCAQPALTLQAASNPANTSRIWRNQNGQVVGMNTNTLTVNQPGLYTLTVTQSAGSVSCTAVDTAIVTANQPAIEVSVASLTLSCMSPTDTLSAVGNLPQLTYAWTGPDGFTATGAEIEVSVPGVYTVVATDPASGCTGQASATVFADSGAPALTAVQGPALCGDTLLFLHASSSTPGVTLTWTGPGGFQASGANITVSEPGTYRVLATAPNGCQSLVTVEATGPIQPMFTGPTSDTLDCLNTSIEIDLSVVPAGTAVEWINPPGPFNQPPYIAVATHPVSGCTDTLFFSVVIDSDIPTLDAFQTQPACGDSVLVLIAASTTPGVTFEWTGPDNFQATGAIVTTTVPGWYHIEATGANGCSTTLDLLAAALPYPEITIHHGNATLNCVTPDVTIWAESDVPGSMFLWIAPSGSTVANDTLVTTEFGVYTVVATSPDGCSSTATTTVSVDASIPEIGAQGGILTCEDSVFMLFAVSPNPGVVIVWDGMFSNPAFTSEPGIYTATATAPNGCTATVSVEVIDSCLISTTAPAPGGGLRVYPNASTGIFFVESTIPGVFPEGVEIYAADGRLIGRSYFEAAIPRRQLDLTTAPAGVYQLRIRLAGRWRTVPLVLVR